MKRKLGVALLIIATTLAGTPEAVKQFHDLNQTLQEWARTSLGSSFLAYAETTTEHALPDRYDYHQVAPLARRTDEPADPSYGLLASFSAAEATGAHVSVCPSQRRAAEQALGASRARSTEKRSAQQVARAPRVVVLTQQSTMTTELARAATMAARAFGAKLNEQQLAELIKSQDLEKKLKSLRIKTSVENLKVRRVPPVRIARLDQSLPTLGNGFASGMPLPPAAVAPQAGDDEPRFGVSWSEPVKRNSKARTRVRHSRRNSEQQHESDGAPVVCTTATDAETTKGFDCTDHDNDK
ncbi:MAG: hypothetical protein ACJ74W_21815 [Pyrinomonadaceae bacterium]